MQSSYPGQPRYPRRSTRSKLTRRGILGAGAVIAAAGVVEAVHLTTSHGTAKGGDLAQTGPRTSGHQHGGGPGHSGTPTGSPSPGTGAGEPSSGATPPASSHGEGDTGPHHSPKGGKAKEEHVTLPPAKVKVHTRPAYYVDQIVKDPPKHAIALTVDDGPSALYTPKVLRLLDKYHMQASFCVIGSQAAEYPKLVRDIHRAGHVIVNHTYTHVQPFNQQTEKRIVEEITKAQRAIERAAGVTPELFRAPGGAWSPFIFQAIAAYGLTPLDWDVDPDDWELPGTKAIIKAMLKGRPGDIVLCHDGGGNRSETVRALRTVLPTWKRRGYDTIRLVRPSSDVLPPVTPPSTPSPSTPPVTPTPTATIATPDPSIAPTTSPSA